MFSQLNIRILSSDLPKIYSLQLKLKMQRPFIAILAIYRKWRSNLKCSNLSAYECLKLFKHPYSFRQHSAIYLKKYKLFSKIMRANFYEIAYKNGTYFNFIYIIVYE